MNTLICPTCGCSLVRLGISKDNAATSHYEGRAYHFCCQGCVDLFTDNPEKCLDETKDMIVCPTCLAEKHTSDTVSHVINDREVFFCRCPHCVDVFRKQPDFYIRRLQGTITNEGVLDHDGCCIRPES